MKVLLPTTTSRASIFYRIFDFFMESSAKKFIFFSSVKAVADSVTGDMLTKEVVSGIYL